MKLSTSICILSLFISTSYSQSLDVALRRLVDDSQQTSTASSDSTSQLNTTTETKQISSAPVHSEANRNLHHDGGGMPAVMPPHSPPVAIEMGGMDSCGDYTDFDEYCGGPAVQPVIVEQPIMVEDDDEHEGPGKSKTYNLGGRKKGEFHIAFGGSWDKEHDWFKDMFKQKAGHGGGLLGGFGKQPHMKAPQQHHQQVMAPQPPQPQQPQQPIIMMMPQPQQQPMLPPQQVVEHIQVFDVQPVQVVETPVHVEAPPLELVEVIEVQGPPIHTGGCGDFGAQVSSMDPCSLGGGGGGEQLSGFGASTNSGSQQPVLYDNPPNLYDSSSVYISPQGQTVVGQQQQVRYSQPSPYSSQLGTASSTSVQQFGNNGDYLNDNSLYSSNQYVAPNGYSQSSAYSTSGSSGFGNPNLMSQMNPNLMSQMNAMGGGGGGRQQRRINRLTKALARSFV